MDGVLMVPTSLCISYNFLIALTNPSFESDTHCTFFNMHLTFLTGLQAMKTQALYLAFSSVTNCRNSSDQIEHHSSTSLIAHGRNRTCIIWQSLINLQQAVCVPQKLAQSLFRSSSSRVLPLQIIPQANFGARSMVPK